jgi:predicted nucleic acid-binding protein
VAVRDCSFKALSEKTGKGYQTLINEALREGALIGSDALLFELENNPHPVRKDYAAVVLSNAAAFTATDQRVEARALEFEAGGMKPLDALHLASAVEAEADFFCTCDDRLRLHCSP